MQSFSAASGEVLAAGRYYKTPNVGQRLNVSRNGASDINTIAALANAWYRGYLNADCFASIRNSWGGITYLPNYGTMGGIVYAGGGHGGSQALVFYIRDLATMTLIQLGFPENMPATMAWAGYADYTGAYDVGTDLRDQNWYDYVYNGRYIFLFDHSYNTYWEYFDGVESWLVIPGSPKSQAPTGTNLAPHAVNMRTGIAVRALATLPGLTWPDDNQKVCVVDTTRNKTWVFRHGSTQAYYFDMSAGLPFTFGIHQIKNRSGQVTNTYTNAFANDLVYVKEADAILMMNGGSFLIFGMSTGVPVSLELTGLPSTTFTHGGLAPSVCWVPTQQAFYIYEGLGDDFCYVLRPSTLDFATCSWTWSRERFAGDAPFTKTPGVTTMTEIQASYRGMKFIPQIGCLAWEDGPVPSELCLNTATRVSTVRTGPNQLWRPPGTVF